MPSNPVARLEFCFSRRNATCDGRHHILLEHGTGTQAVLLAKHPLSFVRELATDRDQSRLVVDRVYAVHIRDLVSKQLYFGAHWRVSRKTTDVSPLDLL